MEIELTPGQAIIFALGVVVAVIVLGMLLKPIIRKLFGPQRDSKNKKVIQTKWKEVEELMMMKNINGYKLAVLEADKLLDLALKTMMLPGENLGQRLKVAVARNPQIRPVWSAHILRNKIAHDTHFEIKKGEAVQAVKQFKQTLDKLGFL